MSEEKTQRVAYVPMFFPDVDFQHGEINSLPIIRSIDKSVKEIKQDLYEHRHENKNEFNELRNEIRNLKTDSSSVHFDVKSTVDFFNNHETTRN